MHFSASVVWITTFRGYADSVQSRLEIGDICHQKVTHFKQDHDKLRQVVVGADSEADAIRITWSHLPLIFVEKTFSLISNLTL